MACHSALELGVVQRENSFWNDKSIGFVVTFVIGFFDFVFVLTSSMFLLGFLPFPILALVVRKEQFIYGESAAISVLIVLAFIVYVLFGFLAGAALTGA